MIKLSKLNDPAYKFTLICFVICILFCDIHGQEDQYRVRTKNIGGKISRSLSRLRSKMDEIAEDITFSLERNKKKLMPPTNTTEKEDPYWILNAIGEE